MSKLFGTDGIRGPANTGKLSPASVLAIGQAIGLVAKRNNDHPRIVIGKDTRASGYMIESALVAGLTSVGADPLLLGPLPTPGTSLMTRSMRADFGVMITASHNPYMDNGLKLFGPLGCKTCDDVQADVETLYFEIMSGKEPEAAAMGKATRVDHAHGRYVEAVKQTVPRGLRLTGLKVVLDCANGAGYHCAPEVLWELGAEVITIHNSPDGQNINRGCGATDTASLRARVITEGADIGLALDGDADRIIGCDESGRLIDGDQILAALANAYHAEGKLRNASVGATIVSNLALDAYLKDLGISVIRSAVGDRALAKEMASHDLMLGAENSGHLILSDFACTGDGLVGAVQMLSLLAATKRPASQVFRCFEPFPQANRTVQIDPATFNTDCPHFKLLVTEAESQLSASERLIVRKSGTEPLLRILIEGPDAVTNEARAENLAGAVASAA